MKNVKTFPPTPLNSQADYVDAILKQLLKMQRIEVLIKLLLCLQMSDQTRWGKEVKMQKEV